MRFLLLLNLIIFNIVLGSLTLQAQDNYTQYVNPFIGTKNMGHTFPGATAPFGMVQLSPETNQQAMFMRMEDIILKPIDIVRDINMMILLFLVLLIPILVVPAIPI